MFEFLFKYPATVFSKGKFVLLGSWPVWVLPLLILLAGAALAWHISRHRAALSRSRLGVIWLLETALAALILFLLWHPAVSIASLRPQQNVVAVLVDNSRSMALADNGSTRLAQAVAVLNRQLLPALRSRFQVRVYRFDRDAARVEKPGQLTGGANATRISDSLNQVMAELSMLPLGAMVLLSDGSDNTGGIDFNTISRIRQQHIPIHTVGFGPEKPSRDVELSEVSLPARALAGSRLAARVTLRQSGFAGRRARLSVSDSGKVLASRDITLKGDGVSQTEPLLFNAGAAGPRNLQFAIESPSGERNASNNLLTRLVDVSARTARILYVEGEPRWEFKFIRRAVEDDRNLRIISMLRTTQNKIYRQGSDNPKELENGFPATAEELFAYDGLILGSVEASYFTPAQQDLIREFVNRRGGGLLFLGGRSSLSDGGYPHSPFAELLPVQLPDAKGTFHRENVSAELTAQGRDSVICRLAEDAERNAERWKKMPVMADWQQVGEVKPGALPLMEVNHGRRTPLLATENYGRGRTAVFATGGSWRWRMLQDHADQTHRIFWEQLLRWLVSETPGQVLASTPRPVLPDETRVRLRAEARDRKFQPVNNARVEARIVGPESETVQLEPQPLEQGVYTADFTAVKTGSYLAEVVVTRGNEEVGRDVVMFRREDGVAENFHTEQNRELLEKLASQTGGKYYPASAAEKLPGEISWSEAGITVRENRDLWDMPIVFLAALMLRGSEWLLRRRWGVV